MFNTIVIVDPVVEVFYSHIKIVIKGGITINWNLF